MDTSDMFPSQREAALLARVAALEAALDGLVRRYVDLAESGDRGSWNHEAEPEVIAARAALGKAGT